MEFPFTVLSQKNTYLVFKTNKLYLIFLNVQAYWLAQAIGASTETTVSNIDVNVVDNNRLLTLLEAKDYATQTTSSSIESHTSNISNIVDSTSGMLVYHNVSGTHANAWDNDTLIANDTKGKKYYQLGIWLGIRIISDTQN